MVRGRRTRTMTYEELKKVNESLQVIDVKGKGYVEVNQRIKAFRMLYPNGSIQTNIESLENGVCVMRAVVFDDEQNVLGIGHAYEKEGNGFINQTSYIENCETSAVGRALGMIGIGIETSIASAEEVQNAMLQQEEKKTVNATKVKALETRCESDGVPVERILKLYKVESFAKLTEKQYANINANWSKIKEMA